MVRGQVLEHFLPGFCHAVRIAGSRDFISQQPPSVAAVNTSSHLQPFLLVVVDLQKPRAKPFALPAFIPRDRAFPSRIMNL